MVLVDDLSRGDLDGVDVVEAGAEAARAELSDADGFPLCACACVCVMLVRVFVSTLCCDYVSHYLESRTGLRFRARAADAFRRVRVPGHTSWIVRPYYEHHDCFGVLWRCWCACVYRSLNVCARARVCVCVCACVFSP